MSTEYPLLDLQSIPSLVLSASEHVYFAKVTPEIASKIINDYNYARNRPLTKRKMLELSSFMRDDTFQSITSMLVFSVTDGLLELIDGQHRLSSMIETDKTYTFVILVTTQPSNKIYSKIDRGKTRSLKDAIRSGQTANAIGLSETSTLKVAVGVRCILNKYIVSQAQSRVFASEEDILKVAVEDYKEESNRIFEMTDHLELARQLTGRLPMSMFLALYKNLSPENHDKIDEFIYGCGSNVGLVEGDVRRMIYVMYSTTTRQGGGYKRTMSKLDEMSMLLTCWDYWYKGKTHNRRFSEAQKLKIFRQKPNLTGTNITYMANVPNIINDS